jgi:hypothetical protein
MDRVPQLRAEAAHCRCRRSAFSAPAARCGLCVKGLPGLHTAPDSPPSPGAEPPVSSLYYEYKTIYARFPGECGLAPG